MNEAESLVRTSVLSYSCDMFKLLQKKLTVEKIDSIKASILAASENNDEESVWENLQPLIKAQNSQKNAALALIGVIGDEHLNVEDAQELLSKIYDSYETDDEVIEKIGAIMESVRDYDDLNAAPPDNPIFEKMISRLHNLAIQSKGDASEITYIDGLSTTARLCSRQYDDLAKASYDRLVELLPEKSWPHYGQGLYCKTRGLFQEGMRANQKAIELAENPRQAYYWNLGICATGAGQGETALKVWKEQGQNIEMGRFDLPEGGYPSCKVKLAQYPLAERSTENDYPGLEETIWIERLSPCHGIIRSVLYKDLGIDYGDVILHDGAPITYHKYGEESIAVFPHLATLLKRNYKIYNFCGTQEENGKLEQLSKSLEGDTVIYSHTENFKVLCSACWNDRDIQHEHDESEQKHVVSGRIAMHPDQDCQKILKQIDNALKETPENRIFSPDLCQAAGFNDRAKIEKRRYDSLNS